MFPPIFAVCSADPGVVALLGPNPDTRIFSFGEAPEDTIKPYAVWQHISGDPENYLAGRPDADGFSLQVDVYAPTGTAARNIAKAIRDAIELKAYVTSWNGESRDPETKLYRYSFDVDWIVLR